MTAVEDKIRHGADYHVRHAASAVTALERLSDSGIVQPDLDWYEYEYPTCEDGWHVEVTVWGDTCTYLAVTYTTLKTPRQAAKDILAIRKAWLGTGKLARRVETYGQTAHNYYVGTRKVRDNLRVDIRINCALPETCTVEYTTEIREVKTTVVHCA